MRITNKVKGIVIGGLMLSVISSNICFASDTYSYSNQTLQRYKHNSYTPAETKETTKKYARVKVKNLESTSKACVWIARGGSSHSDISDFVEFRVGTEKNLRITDEKYRVKGAQVCTGRENLENKSFAAKISFTVNYDYQQ